MTTYPACLKFISAAVLLAGPVAFAQTQPPAAQKKADLSDEIEVIRAYKPVLADAVKIRRSPDLENNKPFRANLVYTVPDLKYEVNADIKRLQAQPMADEKETLIRNNYVVAGAGNLNTGFGEVYLNTGKDEALQAGVFVRHLNQEGATTANFSRQQAGVYGRSIRNTLELNGNLRFERSAFGFYGYDPGASPTPPATIEKQHFNVLTMNGSVRNRNENQGGVDFSGEASAHLFKDAFEASESSFALKAGAGKRAGNFYFGAKAGIDMTGTSDDVASATNPSISNVIMSANPSVTYAGATFKVSAGLGVYRETYQSRTNVFPDVSAEIELVPQFASLYGTLSGSVLKTSLLDLSRENRYINQGLTIKNALQRTSASGGIRGNAGSGFGYKVGVWYKNVEDLPLFVNSPTDVRKFNVVYDGSTEIIGFEGEVSIRAPGVFKLTGKVTAANYSTSTEAYAWAKPNLQILSNASFFINDKLILNGEVLMSSGTKALAYSSNPANPSFDASVEAFTDLSAGAEYRIRQKVGLFIRVNNLLNQTFQRYQFYTLNGLNAFGGLNYSF